jgi:hypothetical protein
LFKVREDMPRQGLKVADERKKEGSPRPAATAVYKPSSGSDDIVRATSGNDP